MKIVAFSKKKCAVLILTPALSFVGAAAAVFPMLEHESKLNSSGPVAISGNTVLANGHAFVRTTNAWLQQAVLSGFGAGIDGDTLVMLPYVYVRSGTTWSLQQNLDWGGTPAISLNTIALGQWAIGYDYNGRVQIWARSGTNWSWQATVTPEDGFARQGLGYSVAIAGDTLVAGAPLLAYAATNVIPAAYVFVRNGTNWTQQAKLTGNLSEQGADLYGVNFGFSVSISGDAIVVGNPRDAQRGSYAGSIYVFARSGTVWNLQQKITAPDGGNGDYFGFSVALQGDTIVAGAPNQGSNRGAAYVFGRSGTMWVFLQKLTASDAVAEDHFGAAVAIGTNAAVISDNKGVTRVYEPPTQTPLLPGLDVAVINPWVNEDGPSSGTFVINRAGSSDASLTVRYTLSGTASNGIDYEFLPGQVTIHAGETSAQVMVTELSDIRYEGTETVVLTLNRDAAYVVGSPDSGAVNILDSDPLPTVTVWTSDPTASEYIPQPPLLPDVGSFILYRSGPTNLPLTVYFTLTGTAAKGTDYKSLPDSITFPAGSWSISLVVEPIDDAEIEGDETVVLTLSTNAYYYAGPPERGIVVIQDKTPWQNADIGAVGATGSGVRSNTLTVRGSGADIAGTVDEFHYFYRAWKGDGVAIVRITAIEQTDAWAMAGIMFRATLDPGSAHAFMLFRAGNRTGFESRSRPSQVSVFSDGSWVGAPCWLKLIRRGSGFLGYESLDGRRWTLVGSANNIDLPETLYIGLAVTSHHDGTLCTATFDQMNLSSYVGVPYAPTRLQLSVYMNRFHLSWTDNSADEQGFLVESSYDGLYWGALANVPANMTSYSDGPYGFSQSRSYRVAAVGPDGHSAYSDVVTGTTARLSFSDMNRVSNGAIQLTVWGEFDRNLTVEASSDLLHWTSLTNYVNAGGSRTITDYDARNFASRFYRALIRP